MHGPGERELAPRESLGLEYPPGHEHYRAYVGPPEDYDLVAAMTFGLLTTLGMRQHHRVLDIGCGSLRVGRLLLPYLNRRGYTGLEPNGWLVAEGIRHEIGQDQVDIKQPRFVFEENASVLVAEGARFDYMVAQSIFSHCGPDLLDAWLAQAARLLDEKSVLVATFIEGAEDNDRHGWIYPDCVAYLPATLARLAASHGLEFNILDWRHPRQTWAAFSKPGFELQQPLTWNRALDGFQARRQP